MEQILTFFREFDLAATWKALLEACTATQFLVQLGAVATSLLLAWGGGLFLRRAKFLATLREHFKNPHGISGFRIALVAFLWLAVLIFRYSELEHRTLQTIALIVTAFVLIHLPPKFLRKRSWMRLATSVAFVVIVLYILDLHDDAYVFLQSLVIPLGTLRISVLSILAGLVALVVFLWLAGFVSRIVEKRVEAADDIPPSMRVLVGKLVRFVLFTSALFATLMVMGIDLTALAVFGGALGLGLGFGLQKVVSNLFSGLILLFDKSIKPGDVIEVEQTYGAVNSLRTRYTSVITRDKKEVLIPNEDFITQRVVNWSFTDRNVRVRANVGIAYGSDVREAIEMCTKAASEAERVLEEPGPRTLLVGFGESSIDLEIRFWIADPQNGVTSVRSEVLLNVWDAFKEHGIEIPFPQRDVRLIGSEPVPAT